LRLDKFLKTSLIFKTRSSGEKAIENGDILLNDKPVKPSSTVHEGDMMTVNTPLKKTTYKILLIMDKNVSKKMAKEMVEIVKEEQLDIL
jgi:ribosomal 50S subunit-recycling heat shock protein